jgi:hypothetical protein
LDNKNVIVGAPQVPSIGGRRKKTHRKRKTKRSHTKRSHTKRRKCRKHRK